MTLIDKLKNAKANAVTAAEQSYRELAQRAAEGNDTAADVAKLEHVLATLALSPENFAADVEALCKAAKWQKSIPSQETIDELLKVSNAEAEAAQAEHRQVLRDWADQIPFDMVGHVFGFMTTHLQSRWPTLPVRWTTLNDRLRESARKADAARGAHRRADDAESNVANDMWNLRLKHPRVFPDAK